MTIERAAGLPASGELQTDVCVIGSGAAGIAVARLLDGSRRDVVLLEAGGLERDAREADDFAVESVGHPFRHDIESRGRWFGGSTNLWFGRIAVPDPIDLAERPWVPHSGWPIDHDELARFFPTAARLLDVRHAEQLDVARWPSTEPTAATFGGDDGEPGIGVFLWADGMFMGPAAQDQLTRSPNVRVLLDATVVELVATERRTALESVVVVGPDGRRTTVRARTFVLAAGGLENPRLLLASGAGRAAVGNDHDVVGRYYLDHPRAEGYAHVDLRRSSRDQIDRVRFLGEKADGDLGKIQLRVTFPESMQRREELLNHGLHAYLPTELQLVTLRMRTRREEFRRGEAPSLRDLAGDVRTVATQVPGIVGDLVRRARDREQPVELVVVDQMEHEPDPDSRVTLRPDQPDRHGLPRLRVDWRIGESTFRSQRRLHERFRDRLAAVGITTMTSQVLDDPDASIDLVDMRHPSGTTRMSADPRTGVVDADCRVHGIDNLYVLGSSVFPTVGHFNPTFTIVALAARLAEHLRGR